MLHIPDAKMRLRELKALAQGYPRAHEFKLISVCLCSAISQALPCFPNPLPFLVLSNNCIGGLLVTSQAEGPYFLQINEVQRGEVTHSRSHRK